MIIVCEDWDFWIRALFEVKMKKINEALVSYRVHPHRMTNNNYLSSFKIQAWIRIKIMSKLISFVFEFLLDYFLFPKEFIIIYI